MAEKQSEPQRQVSIQELKHMHVQEKKKLNQLLKRQRFVNELALENENTLLATKELSGKNETESIIPLGAGIFVNAKITPHSLKRSLPGNVVINSTPEQIEKDLRERISILGKDGEILHKQIVEARTNVRGLTQLLQMSRRQRITRKK